MRYPNEGGSSAPSQALLRAALSGLLCVSVTACRSSSSSDDGNGSTPTGSAASGDTPQPDTACDGGVAANPQVTSTMTVANMTADDFAKQCEARNGIVELQPHCGGSNACRGMSYDSNKQALTEHTCRATNTCAGWSCVVCD